MWWAMRDSGYSVFELLLVILIVSILIPGLVSFLMTIFHWQENTISFIQVREEAVFLQHYLTDQIEQAGYVGSASKLVNLDCLSRGLEINRSNKRNKSMLGIEKIQSPGFLLKYPAENSNRLILNTANTMSIQPNDLLIISDGYHCKLLKVIAIHRSVRDDQTTIDVNKFVNFHNIGSATVGKFEKIDWVLKKSKRGMALYESDNGRSEALLNGVSSFSAQRTNNDTVQLIIYLFQNNKPYKIKFNIGLKNEILK